MFGLENHPRTPYRRLSTMLGRSRPFCSPRPTQLRGRSTPHCARESEPSRSCGIYRAEQRGTTTRGETMGHAEPNAFIHSCRLRATELESPRSRITRQSGIIESARRIAGDAARAIELRRAQLNPSNSMTRPICCVDLDHFFARCADPINKHRLSLARSTVGAKSSSR